MVEQPWDHSIHSPAPVDGPSWSDIADWYDALLAAGSGPHETAVSTLLRLTPTLSGQTVLDVACGQGYATRAVAAAGATRVVGVDSSARMVALARRHGAPPGRPRSIEYLVDDAQGLASLKTSSFDGATCQLALMDIPDLTTTLQAVHRVLRPDGWFVTVVGHPCFLAPDAIPHHSESDRRRVSITGYFDERFWRSRNPQGVRRAGSYHRTLSTYLNAFIRAGFTLDAVEEPTPSERLRAQSPLYAEVPIFFACRLHRSPDPTASS